MNGEKLAMGEEAEAMPILLSFMLIAASEPGEGGQEAFMVFLSLSFSIMEATIMDLVSLLAWSLHTKGNMKIGDSFITSKLKLVETTFLEILRW